MKKTKLISLIASAGVVSAVPFAFSSCNQTKSATKAQFLAKYEEFLADFKKRGTFPYSNAAFSESDTFQNNLIDNIVVEQTAAEKCALKIYVRDGSEEPYQMNCAGMEVTEISYMLSNFEENCKSHSPVVFYSVSDDSISMSIQVTEQPEYGEVRIYKACELVINSKGYMTKYVNIPPKGVTILGYEAILNLIYYPY